jgi:hypothetical protein
MMAKINVDVRTDGAFMNTVKSLVLEQMNKYIGSKEDIVALVRAEIEKRVDRIEKMVDQKFEEVVQKWVGETLRYHGGCGSTYSLDDVMKRKIDDTIRKILEEKINERLEIVVKDT